MTTLEILQKAKKCAPSLARTTTEQKNKALLAIADALGVSPYDVVGSDKPWGTDQQLGLEYARRDFADPAQQAREELAEDPDRKALLNLARYGSAQDVKQVAALIDALRATNPDFYDGDDPA